MILYSTGYIGRAATANRYYFFAFLMTGSLIGLTTAHEFGNFYVFWELMTWTSYFLVVHEQTPKALRAGLVYFLMCAAGAYVMHFGILLVHAQIGSFEFAALADKAGTFPPLVGSADRRLLLRRLRREDGPRSAAKLAAAGPPGSAVVDLRPAVGHPHQGRPVRHGQGALRGVRRQRAHALRVPRHRCEHVLMVLGCLTLIYGEIRALFESELKRMLAFSTLAQIGEITAILAIGTALANDAALLHLTNHAVMKTLLFYAAGAFLLRAGGRRIDDLSGLGRVMPFTAGTYALASFAIMGLPPFSGFVSKFLMIYAAACKRLCARRRADPAGRHYRRGLLHARCQLPLLPSL